MRYKRSCPDSDKRNYRHDHWNEDAKAALATPQDYALFIVAHAGNPSVRKEMADWLKANYPSVAILALNPPYQQRLEPADYNVVLNGPEEWLFVVEASTA